MKRSTPIRVLVVDDSASVRQTIAAILNEEPDIEVIGAAGDPFAAAEKLREETPDAIVLDIEMPRMDGLTFLRKIMAQRPIPVVICSTLTEDGSQTLLDALEAGAIDVIPKPRVHTRQFLHESRARICDAVRAAAVARPRAKRERKSWRVDPKFSADVILPPPAPARATRVNTDKIICIGASTGGTESLREVLEALPADSPGVVVVQHMPEHFTTAFARRLDGLCQVEVCEAKDNDAVRPGRVLIAPGGSHLLLGRRGPHYHVTVKDGPLVSRHKPSVDVLFRSAAQHAGPNAMGVIMTGMGDDGARGLLEMRRAGAFTLAQDEDTCVVFGMPKEAIDRGAAIQVLPLGRIAAAIIEFQKLKCAVEKQAV